MKCSKTCTMRLRRTGIVVFNRGESWTESNSVGNFRPKYLFAASFYGKFGVFYWFLLFSGPPMSKILDVVYFFPEQMFWVSLSPEVLYQTSVLELASPSTVADWTYPFSYQA